uniref:Bm7825 n=1 Tax=Brugia malayi TaxID=6279 RepID=A0A1I9GDK1_BRUMA|nr:Bm7825 [Brugia malayi]
MILVCFTKLIKFDRNDYAKLCTICNQHKCHQPLSTTTTAIVAAAAAATAVAVGRRSGSCYTITAHKSIVIMRLSLIACVGLIILSSSIASAQETSAEPTDENTTENAELSPSSSSECHANEIFNGKTCKCAPG